MSQVFDQFQKGSFDSETKAAESSTGDVNELVYDLNNINTDSPIFYQVIFS